MNKQELKRFIQDNWEGRNFIKVACNKNVKKLIEKETQFMDDLYSDIILKQRAFFIKNDITKDKIPLCDCGCGRFVEVNRQNYSGFRKFYSEDCHRKAPKLPEEVLDKLSNKEWLFHERVVLKKAIETIGDDLGVSHIPVAYWLKRHGIKNLKISRIRNPEGYKVIDDREKLIKLYESGLSCGQIAEPLNVQPGLVARTLKSYGVLLREPNSYERKFKKVSGEELELIDFVNEVYTSEIKTSNRSILNGRELDIYLPDLNLAIEYNGLYSHSYKPWETRECLIKGPNYHLSKTIDCEKQGIRLIHIFSDEWNYKKDIVKSLIKSELGINTVINAKDCQIVEIDDKTKNEFVSENFIDGNKKSTINISLEVDGEIVCLMSMKEIPFSKSYNWKLLAYCNKNNINVVGGFSKLLEFFMKNKGGSIIAYSDLRWANQKNISR